MTDLRTTLQHALADRYTFERTLGEGGMAVVFLAVDRKHNRPVALKVLRADVGEAMGRERFLREVAVTAGLQHPHVLPVFDSGESANHLWYTMPYVEGETLRNRINRVGPLPLDDALQIARDVSSALSYAHEQGIVHRDVKPENVLLTLQGDALVADFGIATAMDTTVNHLTATGMGVGTPHYMAPEQVLGERPIRPQADVYALGVVTHEMLTGRRPFLDGDPAAMLARRFTEGAPSVVATRADVPPAVATLVQRSLEVDPALRPANATRFAALLADAVTAPRQVGGARRGDAANPGPVLWRMRTTFVGVACAVAAIAWFAWPRTSNTDSVEGVGVAPSIAVLPFVNNTGDTSQTFLSDGLAEDLTASLARVNELRVLPNSSVRQFRTTALSAEAIARQLSVTYVLTGNVSRRGDSVRVALELVDAKGRRQPWSDGVRTVPQRELALVIDSMSRSLTRALVAGDVIPRAGQGPATRDSLAYNYYLLAQHHFNRFNAVGLSRSMAYYDSVLTRDSAFVGAWLGRASALVAMASGNGKLNGREALSPLRNALDHVMALDPHSAVGHALRGHAYTWFEWDSDAASREFQQALTLAPRDPTVRLRASFHQVAEGHTDSALALLSAVRQLEPTNLRAITASGSSTFFGRRYNECLSWSERSLELEPSYQPGLQYKALCLSALGRHVEAIRTVREAMTANAQPLMLSTLAIVLAQADSVPAARTVIAKLETLAGETSFDAGLLFRPYAALNDRELFFRALERAIADRSFQVSLLPVDPIVDPVRSDARFAAMLVRAGVKARTR